MMMNLFSIFDPSSSTSNLMWTTIMLPIPMMLKPKFLYNKKHPMLNMINKEMNMLINKPLKGSIPLIKTIFTFILMSNIMALFPFIFTSTAHISISFTLALTMWTSIMMIGWFIKTKNMLIHTIPLSTPTHLMNFMFLIEMISNIIRPITLSIRLTANMTAGHLMMLLLSNFMLSSINNTIPSIIPLMTLLMLETAVSIIQAYVFTTLISLYINETS